MPVAKGLQFWRQSRMISWVCAQWNAISFMLAPRKERAISTGETQKDLTPTVIYMVPSIYKALLHKSSQLIFITALWEIIWDGRS